MEHGEQAPASATRGATNSRRHALASMLGAGAWLPRALAAADAGELVRLGISQSIMGDVSLNDARAAMQIWIKKVAQDLGLAIDLKLFGTTQEIVERARSGQLDAVASNIIEYRQMAEILDPNQIVTGAGEEGAEYYLILTKQNSGIQQLGELKGRRLCMLKNPKMCVAPAWLLTVLEEGHYGPAAQFFGSITTDTRFSRVILPVFFGQVDACLTSKRGFDTMCELNPQVARELKVLVGSSAVVVDFYMFRKSYQSSMRDKVIRAISGLHNTASGQQLATLFHFGDLTVRDASCLTTALSILDRADRVRSRPQGGGRKG